MHTVDLARAIRLSEMEPGFPRAGTFERSRSRPGAISVPTSPPLPLVFFHSYPFRPKPSRSLTSYPPPLPLSLVPLTTHHVRALISP